MNNGTEKIVLGGGCFWCTEAVFQMLKGVISVEPGYAGGTSPNPTYDQVSSGRSGHAQTPSFKKPFLRSGAEQASNDTTSTSETYQKLGVSSRSEVGHAEVIQIEYDSALIKLSDLLTVFFATHDPTTLNRQGADVGTQYRSVIFYTTDEQKTEAKKFIAELNASNEMGRPIVTEVAPLDAFYLAENYHQDYYARNKDSNSYCEIVINPKLEKVQEKFAELLKKG